MANEPCPVCSSDFNPLSTVDMTADEIQEFFNKCHGANDGRFCETGGEGSQSGGISGALKDSDGKSPEPVAKKDVKRGKLGESLVDPSVGTKTIDGVKGYDPKTLKPVPGTDAWLEAHGLDRATFNSRPYVKYEADANDPALAAANAGYDKADRFWRTKAASEGQDGGYIMYKTEIPGTPYGKVPPQVRPNVEVVTNPAIRAYKKKTLDSAQERLATLKAVKDPKIIIKERTEQLKANQLTLERIKKATPESIRADAEKNVARATERVAKAKSGGDLAELAAAKEDLIKSKRQAKGDMKRANKWNPEIETYFAQRAVDGAQQRLDSAKKDPKAALNNEIKSQEREVTRATNAYKKSAAKYVFSPGVTSARMETNPDPKNIENLTKGKGRIYFAMEGSIKNDAVLRAIKKEDPTAAVVNVPSVTLWQQKDLGSDAAGEIKWFAQKYGKKREIVLIPDADGVTNPNVMNQAKALSAALSNFGGGKVLVAAPPLKRGTTKQVDHFQLPSGVEEGRKGVDDHLGAGRGTLGQLQFTQVNHRPSYSLSQFTKAGGATGKKINSNGLPNAENALAAISGIVGPEGSARISKKMLAQAANLSPTSALDARNKLKDLGVIDVEHIWDEKALAQRRYIRNPDVPDSRVRELVKRGIIKEPRTDQEFTEVDIDYSPVITIRDPKYLIKHSDISVGSLQELPTWKPPASFKGWTSPITGKPDKSGLAEKVQETSLYNAQRNRKTAARLLPVKEAAASERAAAMKKKAPPGRRLVRTKAGARRYGVQIGMPIPLASDPGITFMAMPSETIYEPFEPDSEFYNKNHDPHSGRFAPDGGGGSGNWPSDGGRTVTRVAHAPLGLGHVEVDGIKAKSVYEVTTGNGDKIKLYDKTGEADKYADTMLNTNAKLDEMYPGTARNIVVTKPAGMGRVSGIPDDNTYSMVYAGDVNTYWNSKALGFNTKSFREGYQMPSAYSGNTKDMSYTLTHEYGHHIDFSKHVSGNRYTPNPLYNNAKFKRALSRYGKKSAIESYAEAFAEWHHTNGKTKNPAAIALARYEGWYGSGVQASGEITKLDLGDWGLFRFIIQDGVMFADTAEEDIDSDLPTPADRGIGVRDDYEGEPTVIGDIEPVDISEEDEAKADQIMDEVLKELGLE